MDALNHFARNHTLDSDGSKFSVDVPTDLVYYSWQRMLRTLAPLPRAPASVAPRNADTLNMATSRHPPTYPHHTYPTHCRRPRLPRTEIAGDPTTFGPANFLEAMSGVARLVDAFLAVDSGGTYDPALQTVAPMVPDGNTLLHIFGRWLFKGAVLPGEAAYVSGGAWARVGAGAGRGRAQRGNMSSF